MALDNLAVSPTRFQNLICLFSPWLLLGASPLAACLLLLVFTKCVPSPQSASVPPLVLSALQAFLFLEPGTAVIFESLVSTFVSPLTISKVLVSSLQREAKLCGRLKPLSDSEPLLHQYLGLGEGEGECGGPWERPVSGHQDAEGGLRSLGVRSPDPMAVLYP